MEREYTHPDVLTHGVAEGWAEAETEPTRIDWPARQAVAALPFEVVDGRPVNPAERTQVRYGRNELGHWGEQLCADAIVVARDAYGRAWLLMIERGDGHGWALPGGTVDPGEAPLDAALRELREETGLQLNRGQAITTVLPPRYVPDPRASDEAWMVTVPTRFELVGRHETLPAVVGGDDASRAAWVPADDLHDLTEHLRWTYRGEIFPAHRDLLAEIVVANQAA